jgi:hypothetical protein
LIIKPNVPIAVSIAGHSYAAMIIHDRSGHLQYSRRTRNAALNRHIFGEIAEEACGVARAELDENRTVSLPSHGN